MNEQPYFAEGTEAMTTLEGMVDKAGIRNVLYALSYICGAKAEHVAHAWQDAGTGKTWDHWSKRCTYAASSSLVDPLAP